MFIMFLMFVCPSLTLNQNRLYLHVIYGNLHRPVYPTRHEPSVHDSVSVSTCYRMLDDINLYAFPVKIQLEQMMCCF